jgi:small subunit ribosomal protein S17e
MGNVRPTYIKVLSEQLLKRFGSEFGSEFEQNKKKVEELTNIKSKKIRNMVAGYITRKKNRMSAV